MANYEFTPLKVAFDNIPAGLKEMSHWLNWRLEEKDGKWTKIPYRSDGRGKASSTREATWTDFESAGAAYKNGKDFSGIGFALDGKTRLIGIDLDTMDQASKKVRGLLKLLLKAGAYVEWSPSGTGVRAFILGDMNTGGHNINGVEIYRQGRYLTVTGQMIDGSGTELIECQAAVDKAYKIMDVKNVAREKASSKGGDESLGDFDGLLPLDPPRDVVIAALRWINPALSEGEWFKVGQALWAWSGGKGVGRDLFVAWSKCDKYPNPRAAAVAKWQAIGKGGVDSVGIGTVIEMGQKSMDHWFHNRIVADKKSGTKASRKRLPDEKKMDALKRLPMKPELREKVAGMIKKVAKVGIGAARDMLTEPRELAPVEEVEEGVVLDMNTPVKRLDKVFDHAHLQYTAKGEVVGLLQTSSNYRKLAEVYGIRGAWNELKRKPAFEIRGELQHEMDLVICDMKSIATLNGMKSHDVRGYLMMLGRDGSYDPVRIYLDGLEVKGGGAIRRLASHVKLANKLEKKLFRKVFRMWMIQAVAAAYRGLETPNKGAIPRYEHILIFSGAQGMGKSRFLHRLFYGVPDGFKDGFHLNPTDKDSVMQVTKYWGVELGEIDTTFARAGISELKAFLSMEFDTYRQPYAVGDISVPRSTAFCGSVNDIQFLRDQTGNRRMWPFEILDMLLPDKKAVDEAWAEAVEAYLSGEAWWPDKKLEKKLNKHRESAESLPTEIHSLIEYYDGDFSNGTEWLSARQIMQRIEPNTPIRQTHSRAINLFLEREDCKMRTFRRQKQWLMPDGLF